MKSTVCSQVNILPMLTMVQGPYLRHALTYLTCSSKESIFRGYLNYVKMYS